MVAQNVRTADTNQQWRRTVLAMLAQANGWLFFDVQSHLAADIGGPEVVTSDGVHPTSDASIAWANFMYEALFG